jgi:hypothetical protein
MQLSVCNSRPPGSTHHTQGTISQVKSSTTLNRQHPLNNNAVHVSYLEKKNKNKNKNHWFVSKKFMMIKLP